jgi:gas vesicle protein
MRRNSISIFTFFLGTGVGILAGILFAPARGTNVRKALSYKVKHSIEKLQDLIKTLSHTQAAASSQAKAAGQELIEETIGKAKLLLKEANELAAQLEQ